MKNKLTKEKGLDLHSRNAFQIFGKNLDTPVDFVLFYAEETKTIRPKGGTGQAVEMARLKDELRDLKIELSELKKDKSKAKPIKPTSRQLSLFEEEEEDSSSPVEVSNAEVANFLLNYCLVETLITDKGNKCLILKNEIY